MTELVTGEIKAILGRGVLTQEDRPLLRTVIEPAGSQVSRLPRLVKRLPKTATRSFIELGVLPDWRLRLRKPLRVRISKDESSYVANALELQEFGYAEDPMGAVDDLRQTVVELYWSLKSDSERLGRGLKPTWERLRRLIEER